MLVRWVSFTLGSDEKVPAVIGSHGAKLWQYANRRLSKLSALPTQWDVSLLELSRLAGYDVTSETFTIGGLVKLQDDRIGGAAGFEGEARVMGITMDLVHPEHSRVILDSRLTELSQRVLQQPTARLTMQVTVELDQTKTALQEVRTSTATEEPPPLIENAQRAAIPPSEVDSDSGTGAVTIEPLDPSPFGAEPEP